MKNKFIFSFVLLSNFYFSQTTDAFKNDSITVVSQKTKVILEEGTLVKAALKYDVKGGSLNVGDQIDFKLANPVVIGDQVVADEGLRIVGTVTEARSSGVLGRKGKLAFSIDYLYLKSGQVIKLTGQNAKNLNGSGAIVAATSVILTPLALFIPGKGAKFKEGTIFEAFVKENTELR
ncbi:hypothetical protein DSC47_06910 [Elizabethkingia miricola]|uniref:hypothetical protein n=1 Tax=Elizabethkingia bruuniana TaxID=1756149 RepID=UPI00099A8883|nr:hypothetical protein [Elizabethkingia bruuniana]OPC64260.1 hypothetical protein BAY13_00635 [Elizabethkingia bruuniana]RBI92945.1 hypothetical protein DSC47_06910 [Elizabethkingia miricola]